MIFLAELGAAEDGSDLGQRLLNGFGDVGMEIVEKRVNGRGDVVGHLVEAIDDIALLGMNCLHLVELIHDIALLGANCLQLSTYGMQGFLNGVEPMLGRTVELA